ncbi:hypothetical protein SD10_06305 [Spirosoma radiotolerans]|uniref:Uncharacterized protein n=1 Tax=Spirosoma radiotolerans TaxID=1379870 RepID=A0A0E3ZSV1_9BACT|nr:hypothetical protein SD10_06305 [Spirosoma radiotolerans]
MYVSQLLAFSAKAKRFTNQVWPGMSIGPACIFRQNGPAFLINHPRPPVNATYLGDSIYRLEQADLALAGTAQTDINGYLTAHHHYDQSFFISHNQFYAELFHELHHVYQRNHIKTIQFDNPAILLTYPEDHRNDALKQYENECLLAMVQGPAEQFTTNLNRFFSCRMARKNIIGEKYLNYEKSVESAEGPATYCEYKYMQAFGLSLAEKQYIDKRFFYTLIEPSYGREGLRNKHLLTGMLQCLLLSRTVKNWQSAYYQSGLSLNDYFFTKFIPKQISLPDLATYQARATYFTALVKEKHTQHLAAFHQQDGVKVTLLFKRVPDFRGFDPMHAESMNDSLTLHSTLFKVGKSNNHLTIVDQPVLSLTRDQIWFVKQVTFFVPASAVSFNNNTFTCQTQQVAVSWQYLMHEKTRDGYILMVE